MTEQALTHPAASTPAAAGLDAATKRRYRQIAHHLKPVVAISGSGLTDGVQAELDRALTDHELIKVKLAGDREARAALTTALGTLPEVNVVQQIGAMLVLVRHSKTPNLKLSNLHRYRR